ncbi:HEPN domain-containing protein [Micromonospora chalcea]
MPTRRLKTLQRRVRQLESRFLPTANPTGFYSQRQYDGVRAYVVLTHAEIESYVEDVTQDILLAAKTRWLNSQRTGRCIAALMLYGARSVQPPKAIVRQTANDTFEAHVIRLLREHERYVSQDNHGIKEKNLLSVLLPVGVLEADLDPVWLATMNSFGGQRGAVAHNSVIKVQTPPDPQQMRQTVADILLGLETLEPVLLKLKRK